MFLGLIDLKTQAQTKKRKHRNLYLDISVNDIDKIVQFDPFLMLLVGEERESNYEKYKQAMKEFAFKHTINKTWLHFANLSSSHYKEIKEKYQLKKLPAFLHFYEGQLVKKDYRVNRETEPITDLEIKFLHSILENQPDEKDFKNLAHEYLYTIIINVSKEEKTHINLNDMQRVKYLQKVAETVSTLPREEFLIVGMDYQQMTQDFRNRFLEKNDKLQFEGLILYSKESKTVYELNKDQVLDVQFTKDWIYHHSHGILASPKVAYTNIVQKKNWGLVYFFNSNHNKDKEVLKNSLIYFEELAEQYKGKLLFTVCDVYLDNKCQELLDTFELNDKKLPLVRVIYAGKGQGNNFKVFKMQKSMYDKYLPEYQNDVKRFELSNEGLRFFVRDFLAFDVDLDIKCSKLKQKNKKFLEESQTQIKKNPLIPLDINRIVSLNCQKIGKVQKIFYSKNIVILFYQSKVHKNLKKQFDKVRLSIQSKLGPENSKQIIFFAYDLSHNTAHIENIDMNNVPMIRYYRRQDSINGFYSERQKTTNSKLIANAILDFSAQDIYLDTEEIQLKLQIIIMMISLQMKMITQLQSDILIQYVYCLFNNFSVVLSLFFVFYCPDKNRSSKFLLTMFLGKIFFKGFYINFNFLIKYFILFLFLQCKTFLIKIFLFKNNFFYLIILNINIVVIVQDITIIIKNTIQNIHRIHKYYQIT